MSKESPSPTFKPQGISFPADLLEQAKAAARQDNRTLSGYIQRLVQEDLEKALSTAGTTPADNQEE